MALQKPYMVFLPAVSAALEDAGHCSTGFCITDGIPMSSHRPFPCSSYLQIPVDHPHLVAVQDSLQDLLDAVAAGERRKLTEVASKAEFP